VPLTVAEGETNLDVEWYQNGAKIEKAQEEATQCLPGHKIFLSPTKESDAQMRVSMDALLNDRNSGISQAFSNSSSLLAGPLSDQIEWVQSIDYKAALSPSIHNRNNPENTGTGKLQDVKWVATSSSGLIAVAGLDESNALHLFYSPSGKQAALGGSSYEIPSSVGWIRLWRDKISIDNHKKNPDIVSISLDGSLISAAASTGNWIRIYRLDHSGSIASKIDIVSSCNEALKFKNIKAMRFTADSTRLFILSDDPEKVLVFNIEKLFSGENSSEKEFSFVVSSQTEPGPSLQSSSKKGSSNFMMRDMLLFNDGWIAVCSSEIKNVFFIRYSLADCSFSCETKIEPVPNSKLLGEPRSIAFDENSERCYVICNNGKLLLFEKPDPQSSYTLSMTFRLSPDLDKANSLALVKKSSGGIYLVTGGGNGLGIISLDANGHPIIQSSLNSQEENPYGIKSINNVAVLGESIISAGEKSGVVAMFDILGS
jgi:6-phosphogluconolactonase (cycloisomerase 2 family)